MYIVFFLFLNYCIFTPCASSYVYLTTKRISMKIIYLDSELVKDAIRKIQSVQHFRNYYRQLMAYQLGISMYAIHHKFNRMTHLYRTSFDQMNEKHYDHNVFIQRLVEVQGLSMEIDQLIQALAEDAKMREEKKLQKERAFRQAHPTPPTTTRTRWSQPTTQEKDKFNINVPRRRAQGVYFEGNLRGMDLENYDLMVRDMRPNKYKPPHNIYTNK